MPAIANPSVLVGESVSSFAYTQSNGSVAEINLLSSFYKSLTVTDFGILCISVSELSKVLIPWNRITEVWF